MANIIQIKEFDPLTIEFPKSLIGRREVYAPGVHVKIRDLSLGGLIPGMHLGGNLEILRLFAFDGDKTTTKAEIMEAIDVCLDDFIKIHKIYQDRLDKTFLLHSCS